METTIMVIRETLSRTEFIQYATVPPGVRVPIEAVLTTPVQYHLVVIKDDHHRQTTTVEKYVTDDTGKGLYLKTGETQKLVIQDNDFSLYGKSEEEMTQLIAKHFPGANLTFMGFDDGNTVPPPVVTKKYDGYGTDRVKWEAKKYFCFDVETDGLYGEAFAVAAVIIDQSGKIVDQFMGKCEYPGIESEWVKTNCLPHLNDLPEFDSRRSMRDAFWTFYAQYRESSHIMADVAFPVEAQFIRACVEDDLPAREFQGPYPLIDVSSLFFAQGIDPDIDRLEFSGYKGTAHNPLDDAIASAKCALKLLK